MSDPLAYRLPACYVTGYLGDIGGASGTVADGFLRVGGSVRSDAWRIIDARHNRARIVRVLTARGRDAVDVPDAAPAVEPAVQHLQLGLGGWDLEEAESGLEVGETAVGVSHANPERWPP